MNTVDTNTVDTNTVDANTVETNTVDTNTLDTSVDEFFDLERLLHPVSCRDFIDKVRERQMLHLERGDPGYYAPLLDTLDVDRLIANGAHCPDFTLSLIKDGAIAHRVGQGVRRFGGGNALRLDTLDAATVYREINNGATLRLCRLERQLSSLWILAGELERELGAEISVNLYLTPPRSQAFHPHVDRHDVMILQLEGRKRWRIESPTSEWPVEHQVRSHRQLFERPFAFRQGSPEPTGRDEGATEIVLEAGDVLYLPRGFPHCASTDEERSLHLTVGSTPITWHELLIHAVTRQLGRQRLLRTGLSPGFVCQDEVAQRVVDSGPELAEVVAESLSAENLKQSVQDLANRFIYSRRMSTLGQLADVRDLDDLTLDSRVAVRPGISARLETRADGLYFFYSGRVLNLPTRAAEIIEYMLQARCFVVRDIETQLGDKSRLLMTRKLITEGFLTFADAA